MFTPSEAGFDPEALQTLQEAFDKAWTEAAVSPRVLADQQEARKVVAKRIVDAWRDQGARDPEQLKAYALEGFAP